MKRVKVQFAVAGSGNTTAHMIIPKEFIEKMNISANERMIEVEYDDGQIVIRKAIEQSDSIKRK